MGNSKQMNKKTSPQAAGSGAYPAGQSYRFT